MGECAVFAARGSATITVSSVKPVGLHSILDNFNSIQAPPNEMLGADVYGYDAQLCVLFYSADPYLRFHPFELRASRRKIPAVCAGSQVLKNSLKNGIHVISSFPRLERRKDDIIEPVALKGSGTSVVIEKTWL